jgi:alpha-beta hydrolase superfamily lysophospholipase
VAADRRGAGRNEISRGDAPSANALLDDLDAVIEWCSNTGLPIHAVGFCWGANYWVNYLSKKPTSCRSVSLFAPSLFPSALITDQHFEIGDSTTPDQIPLIPLECFTDGPYFRGLIEPDPLRLRLVSTRLNRIMSEFSQAVWMKFLRLKIPVLLALASDDQVVDNQSTARIFARFDGAPKKLIELQGKHGIQFDACNDLVTQLSDWIKQHSNLPI